MVVWLFVTSVFPSSPFPITVSKRCFHAFLSAEFQSGEPDLYLEAVSKPECEYWAVARGDKNPEGLRNKIQQLGRLIMEIKEERSSDEAQQFLPSSQLDSLGEPQFTSKCMYSFYGAVQSKWPSLCGSWASVTSRVQNAVQLLVRVQFRGNKQMKIIFHLFPWYILVYAHNLQGNKCVVCVSEFFPLFYSQDLKYFFFLFYVLYEHMDYCLKYSLTTLINA